MQVSQQGIPLASNVVMLLLAAVLWPVALMTLMRTCTTAGPLGWMIAGTLAGVTGAFPWPSCTGASCCRTSSA